MAEPATPKADPACREDHAAFVARLFRQFRAPLKTYLGTLLPAHADAEDVLQEAYARLLRFHDLDRSPGRARAYLFRVATNLAFDCFRRRRTRGIEEPIDTAELYSAEPLPDQIIGFDEGLRIIGQALREVDPRCRQVFLLRATEELSYDEIAQRLGVSRRTVERAMRQALDVCQRRLRRDP